MLGYAVVGNFSQPSSTSLTSMTMLQVCKHPNNTSCNWLSGSTVTTTVTADTHQSPIKAHLITCSSDSCPYIHHQQALITFY